MIRADAPPRAIGGPEAQALLEEARRRQRRRRRWIASAAIAALLVVLGAIDLGGRSIKPPNTSHPSSPGGAMAISKRTAPLPTGRPTTFVFGMGSLGADAKWAMNGPDLFVTGNDGETWRNAAPGSLSEQDVGDRANSVAGDGEDLWLGASDVIGVVPFDQSINGSDRGTEILRSNDDGFTWQSSFLPGCVQSCGGNVDVDFINSQDGFAALGGGGSGTTGYLFSTKDGGVTWALVGRAPSQQFSVAFATPLDGWAVSGATTDDGGQATGALYRTTDGGAFWAKASGLPKAGTFYLPTLFNVEDGVVLGLTPTPAVYVTTDGGSSWEAQRVPVSGSAARMIPAPLFSAPRPSAWFISWGRSLVETSDSGHHWTLINEAKAWPYESFRPDPKGGAWGMMFSSPDAGWAIVGEDCQNSASGCKAEGMIGTSDGGLRWRYVNP